MNRRACELCGQRPLGDSFPSGPGPSSAVPAKTSSGLGRDSSVGTGRTRCANCLTPSGGTTPTDRGPFPARTGPTPGLLHPTGAPLDIPATIPRLHHERSRFSRLPYADDQVARFLALRERDGPRRYSGDKIIPFPQDTDAQKWVLRFVWTALQAGLPSREQARRQRLADPVRWAVDNWLQVGGDPRALSKKPLRDGSHRLLKQPWGQLRRRYDTATRRFGGTIWETPEGHFVFALDDGGAGSPANGEDHGRPTGGGETLGS